MTSSYTKRIEQVRGGCQVGLLALAGSPFFILLEALGCDFKRLKTPLNTRLLTPGFTWYPGVLFLQLNRHKASR